MCGNKSPLLEFAKLSNIIEAEVKVYWSDAKGTHQVTSTTNFSDIREK